MNVVIYGVISFAALFIHCRAHRNSITRRIKGKALGGALLLDKVSELMLRQSAYLVILVLMIALE